MRSGLNYGSQSGNAFCFGNGNQGHLLGRLGDECDTYAEISLSQEVYNKANNKFTVHTLVAYGTNESYWDEQGNSWQGVGAGGDRAGEDGTSAWHGQRLSFREAYVDYEMPSGITLWAGKRFYQRKDIHIMDFYYLNNSGTGFGVENIGVGNLGSLSFAIIKQQVDLGDLDYKLLKYDKNGDPLRNDNGELQYADVKSPYVGYGWPDDKRSNSAMNSYKLDARWNGIPMWSDATLDIAFIYAWQKMSKAQKDLYHNNTGFLGFIEWTQGNFFGGFNKLSFAYGTDAFDYAGVLNGGNHLGDNVIPYNEDGSGFRFIDWGVIEQSKWNFGYAVLFAHKHARNAYWSHPSGNDWALVLRPSFKWSDYTSTVLEFGFTNQKNTGWNGWATPNKDRVSATKLTLAQQWSPATHFWARPSIRVFGTWLAGDLMRHEYTGLSHTKQHEYILGAQVEAWW
jgi:maltoporin